MSGQDTAESVQTIPCLDREILLPLSKEAYDSMTASAPSPSKPNPAARVKTKSLFLEKRASIPGLFFTVAIVGIAGNH